MRPLEARESSYLKLHVFLVNHGRDNVECSKHQSYFKKNVNFFKVNDRQLIYETVIAC